MNGAIERAEARVRAAIVRAQARCPADAAGWHAWARRWLAGDRRPAHGAAQEAHGLQIAAERLALSEPAKKADALARAAGYVDAFVAAEAAIALAAALRFVGDAEHSAGQVTP